MDQKSMIDDLVAQLDAGMISGMGHVNVDVMDSEDPTKQVETFGSADCSNKPFACSVPTMREGMDRP